WTEDLDPERWRSDYRNHGRDEVRNYLLCKNTIPNASAVLSRRSVLLETLPVDISFRLCGDWLHWGKLLLRTDLAYVAQPLNHWRIGSSNSRHSISGFLEWREGKLIVAQLAHELGVPAAQMPDILMSYADKCMAWSCGLDKWRAAQCSLEGG